jgi:adenylosuccinate lyase
VVRGYLTPALEDISLWHERDLTHSSAERVILPDAFILLDYALNKFCGVLKNLVLYPENMLRNLGKMKGLVASGTLLLLLVDKGMPRDLAYEVVQRNAMRVWQEEKDFKELLLADADVQKHIKPADIEKVFDYAYYMRHIDVIYKRIGLE